MRAFLWPFLSLLDDDEKRCWLYVRRNKDLAAITERALSRVGAGTAFIEEADGDLDSDNGIVQACRIERAGRIAGIVRGSAALDEHFR